MLTGVRAWTIQHEDAWKLAKDRGVLRGDGRRVWKEFRPHYKWLMTVMEERIPRPRNTATPVWCWVEKPDLRRSAHLPKGTRGVCLEVDMPAENILLSEFILWHLVFNRAPIPLNKEEEGAYEESSHQEQLFVETRGHVFNISHDWRFLVGKTLTFQGTAWEIPMTQVRKTTPFIAR